MTVPSTINKLFQKKFKIPIDTLPGTGDKNGRDEDSNKNENIDNFLTSDVYLNDQTINCSQMSRFGTGVEAG